MDRESIAFGVPVVGFFVGGVILVFGLLQGGINELTVVGGVLGLLSVAWLALYVAALE